MTTIKFSYSGIINGQPVVGNGELNADENRGTFDGISKFDKIASDFPPVITAFSVFSVSCSNGAKRLAQSANIHSITKQPYRSIRTVSVIEEKTKEPLGLFRIDGQFSALEHDTLTAEVVLNGSYYGPIDLDVSSFEGYDLPVVRVNGMDCPALFGVTHIPIEHPKGRVIAKHEHFYFFKENLLEELVDTNMKIAVDTFEWDGNERTLQVKGTAEVSALRDGQTLSWAGSIS